MTKALLLLSSTALLATASSFAQNLIQNAGAETALNSSNDWTIVSSAPGNCGSWCLSPWRAAPAQLGSASHTGSSFLYAGWNNADPAGTFYEVRQTVSLTSHASNIDAGWGIYTFEGWHGAWNQSNPDKVELILEYRDGSNTLLGSYSSGLITAAINTSGTQAPWTRLLQTVTVPVNTRSMVVRLRAQSNDGSSVDAYFDDVSMVAGYWPLGFGLTRFDAVLTADGAVNLAWEDNKAHENARYDAQWSNDGKDWKTIARVNAILGPLVVYTCEHRAPTHGTNYYRLAAIEPDGSLEYGPTAMVNVQNGAEARTASVWPVPTANSVTIGGLHAGLAGTAATLLDAQGRTVRSVALASYAQVQLSLEGYASGFYTLRLADGQVLRVVKE